MTLAGEVLLVQLVELVDGRVIDVVEDSWVVVNEITGVLGLLLYV